MKITDEEEINQLIIARLSRTGAESLSRLGLYLRSRGVESTFRLKHHLRRHPDRFALEERAPGAVWVYCAPPNEHETVSTTQCPPSDSSRESPRTRDHTLESLPSDLLSGQDDDQTKLQGAGSAWGTMELLPIDALPRDDLARAVALFVLSKSGSATERQVAEHLERTAPQLVPRRRSTGTTTFGIREVLLARSPHIFDVEGAVISLKEPGRWYAQFPELQTAHPPSTSE